MGKSFGKRLGRVLLAAGLMTATLALPAVATPANDDGEHKVTICHVTNSPVNPYVVITVDFAAFDGEGKNDHTHHVSKDGRTDVVYDAVEGCEDTTGGTTGDDPTDGTSG